MRLNVGRSGDSALPSELDFSQSLVNSLEADGHGVHDARNLATRASELRAQVNLVAKHFIPLALVCASGLSD